MKISPDNPAFPRQGQFGEGLTIRAEFAKAAMMGLEANTENNGYTAKQLADLAVEVADALIARLNQDEK